MNQGHHFRHPRYIILLAILALLIAIFINWHHTSHVPAPQKKRTQIIQRTDLTPWQCITAQSGDSIASIFHRLNLSAKTLQTLLNMPLASNGLTHLKIGQKIYIKTNSEHVLLSLKTPINLSSSLIIQWQGKEYIAYIKQLPLHKELLFAKGIVHSSLLSAVKKAKLPSRFVLAIGNILSAKINFSKEIKPGDHFSLLYNAYYLNGKKTHTSHIQMLIFWRGIHRYVAIRFKNQHGQAHYYRPTGQALKPMLTRTPVKYTRISSYFSWHRYHPLLHIYRPHLGVDYATPRGTPIHAAGDGTVIFMHRDGGYGNMIRIRHDAHYVTLYAHMSRFAKHLYLHEHVHKGQIIGYVGSTGLSTGPHLHFGVYVDGVAKNPLTVKVPGAKPISHQYRKAFQTKRDTLEQIMDQHMNTLTSSLI